MNRTPATPEEPTAASGENVERPEGEIELTPRMRIGTRANVLAGLALTSALSVGIASIPTVTSINSVTH